MRRKKFIYSSLLIFVLPTVFGATFGSFPYQIEEETDDLKASYKIGLINPGQVPLDITLSAESMPVYNASFSENDFRLKPSKTKNPTGSGWYYLGDGRYTKIRKVDIEVHISKYREDNSVDIPLTIRAETGQQAQQDGGSEASTVQIRDYMLQAIIDPRIRPETRDLKNGEESENLFWKEKKSVPEEDEGFNLRGNKTITDTRQKLGENTSDRSLKNLSEKNPRNQNETIDKTTIILLAGIASISLYIMRVI